MGRHPVWRFVVVVGFGLGLERLQVVLIDAKLGRLRPPAFFKRFA